MNKKKAVIIFGAIFLAAAAAAGTTAAADRYIGRGRASAPVFLSQQRADQRPDLPVDVLGRADAAVPGAVDPPPPQAARNLPRALPAAAEVRLVLLVDVGSGVEGRGLKCRKK